jgi:hypothetical protein
MTMFTKLKTALPLAIVLSATAAPQAAQASDGSSGHALSRRCGGGTRASAHAYQMIRETHPRRPDAQPRWIDNPASPGG